MKKQQIYDVIINALPVGFSMVDKKGIIVDFNPAAEEITGYLKEEVIGKSHLALLHGTAEREACPLFKYALLESKQTIAAETVITRKSGEPVSLSVTTAPLLNHKGVAVGGIELFRDITELKRLEQERKNILAMFAHDMKNPIIIAEGFLSRLLLGKSGPLTELQQTYLFIIRDELGGLLDLITSFLEFSRFEAKEYKPVPGPFNIETDIHKHIEAAKVEAEAKGVTLLFEFPEKMIPVITADAMMVDRVIRNLLGNALKHTPSGGTVTVRLLEREHDILVQVADTGVGIAAEHLPYLFGAFYRVDRDEEGSGLGLAIAKSIIDAHGGKIWVESTPGRGSTFSFTLPKH
ncbi:MAG: PAS domain-containing sensor histidine kinase [Alphaproteobacteria bacterium]|uniref:histidine kinase n=1 Tax=Candidatus Nitrobium versatile TaxID=2884831 RepID=A0A953M194_9BACT|nr:PAS domain-containing sensor histidine kinase [Candidatus Nitrobium versatile]